MGPLASARRMSGKGNDIAEALVIAFAVIARSDRPDRAAQMTLAERDDVPRSDAGQFAMCPTSNLAFSTRRLYIAMLLSPCRSSPLQRRAPVTIQSRRQGYTRRVVRWAKSGARACM